MSSLVSKVGPAVKQEEKVGEKSTLRFEVYKLRFIIKFHYMTQHCRQHDLHPLMRIKSKIIKIQSKPFIYLCNPKW